MSISWSFKKSKSHFIILLSVYFTFVLNFPFLSHCLHAIEPLPKINWLFVASIPLLLLCLQLLFWTALSHRFIIKPVAIILILLSALVTYAEFNYSIVFDYGMVQNAFETDSHEAIAYLNMSAVISFVLFGVLPAYWVYQTQFIKQTWTASMVRRVGCVVIALVIIVLIGLCFYSNYASVGRNNKELKKFLVPMQFIDSSTKYIKRAYLTTPKAFDILDQTPSVATNQPPVKRVVVMVVGETARAESFRYNGYERDTNPYTHGSNLEAYQKVSSCGTATAVSVPCMFSQLTRQEFDNTQAENQQNALDLILLAGADVLWVDNNSGCKGVCKRVTHIQISTDAANKDCDGEYCFDEVLIQELQTKLAHLTHDNTLIVLHMMGSHGPTYYRRYPKNHRLYTPDCPRSDIQNCSKQTLINTYDNTIAYTDFVLSEVIRTLNSTSETIIPAMLYVSDHGESLGEMGAYLHGFPYSLAPTQQTHIPLLTWIDKSDMNIEASCQQEIAMNKSLSHDSIFHSLLGLMKINSQAYQAPLDIFSWCKDKEKTS